MVEDCAPRKIAIPFGDLYVSADQVMTRLMCSGAALALTFVTALAHGGDRQGVEGALQKIGTNWADAEFSVDLTGLTNGEAIVDQPLQIEYEAAHGGYVSYLRMSSHGEVTLIRGSSSAASATGTDSYIVQSPLGTEEMIVLFSNKPLDSLFSGGARVVDIGVDKVHAQSFVHQLDQMRTSGLLVATRKYHYTVATPQGGTEYTTRSIVFQVENAGHGAKAGGAPPRIPSRVEFEFDSDRLTERGKRDLDEFGEALVTRLSDTPVVLEGHTDSVGSDEYNLALSQRRAEAARQYLIDSFGLNQSKIIAQGKGKASPVASNESESERSRNRRVDFVFSAGPSSP